MLRSLPLIACKVRLLSGAIATIDQTLEAPHINCTPITSTGIVSHSCSIRKQSGRMFRNQYDTDVTTWSPAGRLHQVEYAMEAVKQGSAAIGLRSRTHVVLATVNKASSELSAHQKKLFKIDNHIGIAMAGLTADGRVLSRYMRSECINHNFVYESPLPVGRLVVQVADKAQVCCHGPPCL